jgi:hypothetical protein
MGYEAGWEAEDDGVGGVNAGVELDDMWWWWW